MFKIDQRGRIHKTLLNSLTNNLNIGETRLCKMTLKRGFKLVVSLFPLTKVTGYEYIRRYVEFKLNISTLCSFSVTKTL